MWVIPSARNCSMIATLPGLATMRPLPAVPAPDDALAVLPVAGERQAGHAVALRADRLPVAQEGEDDVVQPAVVGQVHDRAAAADDQQRVVLGDLLVEPVADLPVVRLQL